MRLVSNAMFALLTDKFTYQSSHTAFVKAAARDVKAYLRSRNSQALVGYSSVDGERDFRDPLANYLTCGNDTVSLDIYGLSTLLIPSELKQCGKLISMVYILQTTMNGVAIHLIRLPGGKRSSMISQTWA